MRTLFAVSPPQLHDVTILPRVEHMLRGPDGVSCEDMTRGRSDREWSAAAYRGQVSGSGQVIPTPPELPDVTARIVKEALLTSMWVKRRPDGVGIRGAG